MFVDSLFLEGIDHLKVICRRTMKLLRITNEALLYFHVCHLFVHRAFSHMRCSKLHKEVSSTEAFKIVGIFPLRRQHASLLSRNGMLWVEKMKYTINHINRRYGRQIFGYQIYDSCGSLEYDVITSAILDMMLSDDHHQHLANETTCPCAYDPPVSSRIIGIIGAAVSSNSMYINKLVRGKYIPMISYASTSPQLSNKIDFPHFFRTVPSDIFQAKFVRSVLEEFGWTYVSLIAADESYGRAGMEALDLQLRAAEICAAVKELFNVPIKNNELHAIFDMLRSHPESKVVILWASSYEVIRVLKEAAKYQLHNKTWIISETTAKNAWFHSPRNKLKGNILVVVPLSGQDKKFEETFLDKNAVSLMNDTWMHGLIRKLDPKHAVDTPNVTLRQYRHKFDFSNRIGSIDDAVQAYAVAFENYVLEKYGCNLISNSCHPLAISEHEEFVNRYLKPVRFVGLQGNVISFDENGDYTKNGNLASYELYLVKYHEKRFSLIAEWCIKSKDKAETLEAVNSTSVSVLREVKSNCADTCKPGFYPLYSIVRICCWTCVPCLKNHVKSYPGNGTCKKCSEGYMSNQNRTECKKLNVVTLSHFKSAYIIYFGSGIGVTLSICMIITLIISRDTPIVRATSFRMSMAQILTLFSLFMLPNLLVSEDNLTTCIIREYGIWFLYTLVISITLARSSIIYHIFHMKKTFNEWMRVQLNMLTLSIILGCLFLEALIIICLMQQHPITLVYHVIEPKNYKVYRVCQRNASYVYQFSYTIFLQIICGVQSFRSRKLPENYNEAACITFATFSSAVVIASGIPIIESRNGYLEKDLTLLIVTTMSNLLQLVILYGNKAFVIWCQPKRNTRAHFQKQRVEYVENEVTRNTLTVSYGVKRENQRGSIFSDSISSLECSGLISTGGGRSVVS